MRIPTSTTARSYCIPFTTITDDGGVSGVVFNDAVSYYDCIAWVVDCEFRPKRDDVTRE